MPFENGGNSQSAEGGLSNYFSQIFPISNMVYTFLYK